MVEGWYDDKVEPWRWYDERVEPCEWYDEKVGVATPTYKSK